MINKSKNRIAIKFYGFAPFPLSHNKTRTSTLGRAGGFTKKPCTLANDVMMHAAKYMDSILGRTGGFTKKT
jgi:hypothetical protein